VVAGYRIEAAIGEGGFGAVFRAVQLGLGRAVALKLMLPELVGDHDDRARFQREAELAQHLQHPNTVRLLDFGVAEGGVPYIVWELLRGEPLDAVLRGGGLPAARVARVASQVLKALMEAHGQGIVHRDIKPSNIFLCEFSGERDFVKVLDFGIAKAISPASGPARQGITRQGQMVGTPSYMAPEQVAAGPSTPLSDLYALGLVMAEAFTGERVVRGASSMEIAVRQASPAPVALPEAALASPLGPVIRRATEKRMELRFASAGEMLEHIEAAMRTAKPAPVTETRQAPAPVSGEAPTEVGHPAFVPVTGEARTEVGHPAFVPEPPHTEVGHPAFVPEPPRTEVGHPAFVPGEPPTEIGAPPVMSALQARPAKGASRRRGGVSPIVLVAAGGGTLALVGALAWLAVDSPRVTTRTRGVPAATTGPRRPGGRLRSMSNAALRERVVAEGWEITSESVTEAGKSAAATCSLGIKRSTKYGVVTLYRYEAESVAAEAERVMRGRFDFVVARDGGALLMVSVSQDPEGARQLAAEITR
jgi:serine/threonine-protein kinase